MARLPPGSSVGLRDEAARLLSFPPAVPEELLVAVHPSALRAPDNGLTLVAELSDGEVTWVGAIDEAMLAAAGAPGRSPRQAILGRLLTGERLWEIVWPGALLTGTGGRPYLTVYDGRRPWLVLGELANGELLAAPLNDASTNPRWYAPIIEARSFPREIAKRGQVELAHLWSIPAGVPPWRALDPDAGDALILAVVSYFDA